MNSTNFKSIINEMGGKRVLVVGDIMLDEYQFGNVRRISQEAPVPIVEVQNETRQLGGAGNVIKNLTSLDAEVSICSVVGNDIAGSHVEELILASGVKPDNCFLYTDETRKTTVKTRLIAQNQHMVRIDREDLHQISDNTRKAITTQISYKFEPPDAIIISDYGKGLVDKRLIDSIRAFCVEHDIFLYVDPKERNFDHYKKVDMITPNLKELSYGSGFSVKTDEEVSKAASQIFKKLRCKNILATRGEDGMTLFSEDGNVFKIPACAHHVYDVTGAGDTVISVFTLARAAGATMHEAAIMSNVAAGIVVGEVGAVSVKKEDLLEKLRG